MLRACWAVFHQAVWSYWVLQQQGSLSLPLGHENGWPQSFRFVLLTFIHSRTHSKSYQPTFTASYLHPQTFPPLHGMCGSKLVTFQFKPCHICQKHILNNSDFSLSLVHSKANPQRLRLESYFIKVCKCWWGLLAAIPLHVCVYVLKGALELPSNVAVINTNFFLQTVAPC